jgi:hypothetical protein
VISEEVLQGVFPHKAVGTALEFTFEKFVVDQGFANLPDANMRIFHLPDLTALEGLNGDGLLLRRVLHGHEFSKSGDRKREKFVQRSRRRGKLVAREMRERILTTEARRNTEMGAELFNHG